MMFPSRPGAGRHNPRDALLNAERMLGAYTHGYTFMQEHLNDLERDVSYFPDPIERSYWMSRTEFLLGWLERTATNRSLSIQHYSNAAHFARNALTNCEFSDAYRCLADALGQLLTLRGIVYQMSHGISARDAAVRALDLDWGNLRAHISAGAWYMNAPEVAGGNAVYTVEILTTVITDSRSTDVEQFVAHGLLALAYEEIEEPDTARKSYYSARAIFPKNPWLPEIAAELDIREMGEPQ